MLNDCTIKIQPSLFWKNWGFSPLIKRNLSVSIPYTCRDPQSNISPIWKFGDRVIQLWRKSVILKSRLIGKDPDAEKDVEGRRRRGWQRMRWVDSITNSMDMNLSKLGEIVEGRGAWSAAEPGMLSWVAKSRTLLSDWTTTIKLEKRLVS